MVTGKETIMKRFRDIYFGEAKKDIAVGDTVYLKGKPTAFRLKSIDDDGKYNIVDAKTRKHMKTVDPDELEGHQQKIDLDTDTTDSVEPKEKKKYKLPKKLGKPEDVEQTSLF